MSQIEVDRGGFQSFFGYVSDDAGETFSQTFTATGSAITHLTFPVDLDTSSTATMRVLIADVTGGAIGAILYDSGTISIAPISGESLGYGGGPFRDVNLDMNVTTIPGHQYVILFDGLPDADGSDRIVLGWNPDSTYGGGSAGYWFADPSVGLSFASNNTLQGDYAFTMTFADANVINGTPDDDFLVGTSGDDTINAFAGNDVVNGLAGNDTIDGGDDHDLLNGQQDNDTIYGGNGDDLIRPGTGNDYIDGGSGFDRLSYASVGTDALASGVTVSLLLQGIPQNTGGGGVDLFFGIEHLTGTRFDDNLTGDNGDNWLWGGFDPSTGVAGNDTISGGGGNDLIQIGLGNATVDGGTGTDALTFFGDDIGVPTGVTFSLALQGGVQATSFGNVTATNFENLGGTIFADNLSGDGNDNVIAGDQGNDTLFGGAGNDTLYGDGQFNVDTHGLGYSGPIVTIADVATSDPTAVDGNDILDGGAGDDILNGGGGNDTASFASWTEGVFASLNNSGNGSATNAAETEFDTLISIENLSGSAFNDQLIGNSSDNVLSGGDGDDLIFGRGGNDTLIGGNGNDFFRNGVGNDVVDGGTGFDRMSSYGSGLTTGVHVDLNLQGIAQDTGHGMDTLIGIESLSGTDYDDTLIGDNNDNWLLAADGNDTLIGNGGNDLLDDLDGELGPASGNHTFDGGTGNDTVGFNGAQIDPDGVTVSLALQGGAQDSGHGLLTLTNIENLSGSMHDDVLTGDGNSNTLSGHAGNDSLVGGDGDDSLYGDGALVADTRTSGGGSGPITFFSDVASFDPSLVDGNDVLEGGAGNDHLDGGGGSDTASYAGNGGPVEVNLQFGFADEYDATGTTILSTDTLVSIENAIGSAFDDALVGSSGDNVLQGLGGNDTILGQAGNDTIEGGDGSDIMRGDTATSVGNDVLIGGAGDDHMRGGAGVDSFDGGSDSGGESIYGGIGDRISFFEVAATAGVIADLRTGVISNDGFGNVESMTGIESLGGDTAYIDTFYGNDGRNTLLGGRGDQLYGFGGDDNFSMAAAAGTVDGGTGTDTLQVNSAGGWLMPDTNSDGIAEVADAATEGWFINLLAGNMFDGYGNFGTVTGIENVDGSELDDTIRGDNGNNVLSGLGGDDFILGMGGDDTIIGGDGNDNLRGDNQLYTGGPFGNDILIGGAGDDLMRGGPGVDSFDGGSDTGTVNNNFTGYGDRVSFYEPAATAGAVADLRTGVISNDGYGNVESMVGVESLGGDTAFADTFYGNDGTNFMFADLGDSVYGFGGDDIFQLASAPALADGGDGIDRLTLTSSGGWLMMDADSDGIAETADAALAGWTVDLSAGTLTDGYGNSGSVTGFENVDGSELDDTLIGDGNANVLNGLDGNDTLEGRGGDDTLDGGNGSDTASYEHAVGPVEVYLSSEAFEYAPDGLTFVGHDTLISIENATGSAFDDFLFGDGNANVLNGLGGNDDLLGGGGDDTLIGGAGEDTADYTGASGAVTVNLTAGTATGDGNDTLIGIEDVFGSGAGDHLIGDGGNNQLFGFGGADVIEGMAGNDTLRGMGGNDTLLGGIGNDFLNGGIGNDTIDGGAGFDRATFFSGATAGVHVDLNLQGVAQDTGQGMDTLLNIENVSGTVFGDTLIGDNNNNWLWGSPSTDSLTGIVAATNNDTLDGGGGNDLLMVGIGNHSLTGGTGTDTVAFTENGSPEPGLTISLALQGVAQATGAGSWTLNGIENLSGGINNDALTGDGNDNVLAGDQGNDTLVGGGGNDTLYGDGRIAIDYAGGPGTSGPIATFADGATADPAFVDGNDRLEGGLGDDTLNGGGGSDTASYAHASGDVQATISAGGGGGSSGADGTDTFVSIENLLGSAFNDQLTGNNDANVLDGSGGNDTLRGRGGNDTLLGGNGNDFLNGGIGDDTIDGGVGFDRATYFTGATAGVHVDLNLQGVAQDTGQGFDTLTNIENVSGTNFGDTLIGDNNDNWLWGSPSTDGVNPPTGTNNDTLDGGGGNDLLTVGIGNHSLTGGTGIDTVSFTENGSPEPGLTISLALQGVAQATGAGSWTLNGIENLSGSVNNDTLTGDGNANVLAGNTGDDNLVGGGGNDTLYGDGAIGIDYGGGPGTSGPIATFADVASVDPTAVDGNDTLEGGLGNDTLNGGGGSDTASYAHASGSVTVDLAAGTASGADGNDTLISIENATGSAFNDTLLGSSGANVLSGGDGHDFIAGNAGNDTLNGGNGDDFLRGGLGDDMLNGGAGWDRVAYSTGATAGVTVNLTIVGVAQNTGQGFDTLTGIENVSGTRFNDVITGDGGDNWLWGGSDGSGVTGNDVINAGGGNDLVEVGTGTHTLTGGSGNDTLSLFGNSTDITSAGVAFDLTLQGAAQNTRQGMMNASGFENVSGSIYGDNITGDAGANILLGDVGNDTIRGGDGDDRLYGDGRMLVDDHGTGASGPITLFRDADPTAVGGNDTLLGGKGDDWLYGGRGNDTLTGNQGVDRYVIETNSGTDHVTDFAVGTDKVLFQAVSGIDDFTDLTLTKVGSNTVITWGTGDSLTLDGIKPSQLHASDFEFSASAAAASAQEFSRAEIGTGGFHSTSLGGDAFEQGTFMHEVPHII